MSTLKINKWYDYAIEATLIWRESTALGMLELMNKLRQEQETEGPYDEFLSRISCNMQDYNVFTNFSIEMFKGISDVIVEMKIAVFPKDKQQKGGEPIQSEKVAGTIFKEVFDYFGFVRWNSPTVISDSGFDEKEVKALLAFKKY